jgi:hypothetical protein
VLIAVEDGSLIRGADLSSCTTLDRVPLDAQLLLLGALCSRLRRAAIPALSEQQVSCARTG